MLLYPTRSTVARGQHVAHSDISNEKTFFVNFPLAQPKQNAQVSLKTYTRYLFTATFITILIRIVKKVVTQLHLSRGCELRSYTFFQLLSIYFTEIDVDKNTKVKLIIHLIVPTLIRSSFCLLN